MNLPLISAAGLSRFQSLQAAAVHHVARRFLAEPDSAYGRLGDQGENLGEIQCREDLAFHLEFLRPVLEFGLLQPMLDYLYWLRSVLSARGMPPEQVGRSLQWLAAYFREKIPDADGEAIATTLEQTCHQLEADAPTPQPPPEAPPAWPETGEFQAALLAGRQREALALINRCLDRGLHLVDIEQHLIQPALYRIGELWQANQISVAQEHLATAIAQSVMTVGLLRSPVPPPRQQRVILACVQGNHHMLGLRMVSDAFQLDGWDVDFLGANVPTADLVRHAAENPAQLIGLSVSFPQQLHQVRQAITALDERLGSARPPVIVGGLAINRFSGMATALGAEASAANASEALAHAPRRLVP